MKKLFIINLELQSVGTDRRGEKHERRNTSRLLSGYSDM